MPYTQPNSSNNIYLLTSLQNYFREQNASPRVNLEIKEISLPDIGINYSYGTAESIASFNLKNWMVTVKPKSYLTFDDLEKELALVSYSMSQKSDEYLKFELTKKLRRFQQVRNVYINLEKDLTVIRVILDTNHYDCDLMSEIFKKVEFPIKDTFQDRLFHFDYIPYYSGYEKLINPQRDKLIFSKETVSKSSVRGKTDFLEFDEYIQPKEGYAKFSYA